MKNQPVLILAFTIQKDLIINEI